MSDIYRPLFVMVEAVEAECQRLLSPPPPKPSLFGMKQDECISLMRRAFDDDTLHIEREAAWQAVRIGHRCKVCRRGHSVIIEEMDIAAAEHPGLYIAKQIRALLERPCDVDLTHSPAIAKVKEGVK